MKKSDNMLKKAISSKTFVKIYKQKMCTAVRALHSDFQKKSRSLNEPANNSKTVRQIFDMLSDDIL